MGSFVGIFGVFSKLKVGFAVFLLVNGEKVVDVEQEVFFESIDFVGCVGFEDFGKGVILQRGVVPDFRGLDEGYEDDVFPVVKSQFGFGQVWFFGF
jgi:hypothetical protein